YRPGQAHDQQGAVMDDYGTTQDPSRGDYVRPAQGEHREVPGPNPFYSVQPTPEMVEHMQMAASQYDLLRTNIKNSTHVGRYQSLALTALEESAMWLNKAITHG